MSSEFTIIFFTSLENFNKASFAFLRLRHYLFLRVFPNLFWLFFFFTLYFNPSPCFRPFPKIYIFIIWLIISIKMFLLPSFVQQIFIGILPGIEVNTSYTVEEGNKTWSLPFWSFQWERQTVINNVNTSF